MAELVRAGVRLFTDAISGVQNDRLMRTALEYASGLAHLADGFDVVVAQPGAVESLTAGGVMHEGEWSSRSYARPASRGRGADGDARPRVGPPHRGTSALQHVTTVMST